MKIITRHVLRTLMTSTLSVASVLVAGVWLTQSLRYVDVIVNRGVSLRGYFSLIGFLIPELLALILPICVLIGVLFTYNRLRSDSELVVFQANGLSYWQLAKPALFWASGIAVFVSLLNIYIVPSAFRQLRNLDHQIRNEFSTALIREGAFNSFQGTTVYVKSRFSPEELRGVFIYQKGAPKKEGGFSLPFAIIADKGLLQITPSGIRLLLSNGQRQEFDPLTQKSSFFRFSELNFDLSQLYSKKQKRLIKPCERTLGELLYPDNKTLDSINSPQLQAEAHQRILFPFLAIMYALVALIFLLRPKNTRHKRIKWTLWAVTTSSLVHVSLILLINFNGIWSGFIPLAYGFLFFVMLSSFLLLENKIFPLRKLTQ